MGRYKKIVALLAVLAVASAATFGVSRYERQKEIIKNSDEIILEIDSGTVSALSWEYGSNALSFHRDGKWLYDEDEAFPVDEEKINRLLEVFQEFGVSFVIEEVEDYGQYGLDDPVCTVRFTAEDTSYEVLLGDFSTMDSERYVSVRQTSGGAAENNSDGTEEGGSASGEAADKVYLVKDDPLDYFDAELSDVIDHDEALAYREIVDLSFSGAENKKIVYEEGSSRTYCADDVYFLENDGGALPLDTSKVSSYLQTLCNLTLKDYVTYNATEAELETYGLNDPELTVTVNYLSAAESGDTDELQPGTFVLHISRGLEEREKEAREAASENAEKEDGKDTAAEDAGKEDGEAASAKKGTEEDSGEEAETAGDAYVRIGDSQIIYKVNSAAYRNIMDISYDSLRHSEVFTAGMEDVSQITVRLDGTEYTITSRDGEHERSYYYQDEELDISGFRSALKALSASEFTAEEPGSKEEVGLTLYLDNENYPTVEISLYRYDGVSCLALVDGEPFALVDRTEVVDLIEEVNKIVLGVM